MEELREAAARGVRTLGNEVIRSEDFGALPESSQRACLRGVRSADAVVLLMGERYGQVQESGISATHEEYREARERCPVLVFVRDGVDGEPRQDQFLREVREWEGGHAFAAFSSPGDLQDGVIRALHDLEVASARGTADPGQMLEQANALVPESRYLQGPTLGLVVVGAPRQEVLRPAALEDPGLIRWLKKEAQYGEPEVLDSKKGTEHRLEGDALLIEQEGGSLLLGQDGNVRLLQPARPEAKSVRDHLPVMIEEDVLERVRNGLQFVGRVLDRVDPLQRLSDVAIVLALLGAGYSGWRTRAEHERSPNQGFIGSNRADRVIVHLSPPTRRRPALLQEGDTLAQDLVVLLRRRLAQ